MTAIILQRLYYRSVLTWKAVGVRNGGEREAIDNVYRRIRVIVSRIYTLEYNRLVSRGPGELPFRTYTYRQREGGERGREGEREKENLVNDTFPPRQRKKIEK